MTNLREINFGLNQYCGPAVLSALTGKSTDECASVIMSITGKAEVGAVDIQSLIKAFQKLRFDVNKIDSIGRTLYGSLIRLSDKDGFYIIIVPKHVVAVEVSSSQIYLVDNASKSPLPANSSARLMQKVECVYRVTPKPEPKFIRTEIDIIKYHSNNVHIVAWDIYDTDKMSRHLGQFTFRDESELREILKSLNTLI